MFIESIPQSPQSAHPLYEWQAVTVISGFPVYDALLKFLALLPLLGILIILATSGMILFGVAIPRLALLQRIAAGWGLTLQLLFNVFVFMLYSIGYAHIDIAGGFVFMPTGFIIMLIGTWPGALRPQTIFTPLACVFLTIGSVILGLGWLNYNDFFRMFSVVFIWLPMIFLLGEFGLLIAKQWVTAALILPLVMVTLYGLFFLLAFIIPGAPGAVYIALLIIFNAGVYWLTLRTQRSPKLPTATKA